MVKCKCKRCGSLGRDVGVIYVMRRDIVAFANWSNGSGIGGCVCEKCYEEGKEIIQKWWNKKVK